MRIRKLRIRAAAYYAISEQKMNSFIARKYPFFADIDIMGLANTIKVHTRNYCWETSVPYEKYPIYVESIWFQFYQFLTPSAVVDGLGDVYPLED